MNSAALDPDEDDFMAGFITLGNFMPDPSKRPFDGLGIENQLGFRHKKRVSRGANSFSSKAFSIILGRLTGRL